MFMIVKKYKNMLNQLFDHENYDPKSNFELMRIKPENIKQSGGEGCECSEKLTENLKNCFIKMFSCNCCDCEVEEYDEDNSEEIELEIIRKREKRKKRKREKREREEISD